jgi:hypothetical protein
LDWFGDFYHAYYRFNEDGVRRDEHLLSPEFLGMVDHAFFRCPFASIEDLTAASSGHGVSEKDINGFYELMDKDHRQGRARDDLRKGKYTT